MATSGQADGRDTCRAMRCGGGITGAAVGIRGTSGRDRVFGVFGEDAKAAVDMGVEAAPHG